MKRLLLLLCLAPQAQNAEAKKLLDALAPPLKDPPYAQFEFERGSVKGVGFFERQKAWRLDTKNGESEMVFVYDGKATLNYMKKSNRFISSPGDSFQHLQMQAGGLAEIYYSGNADRILRDAQKVTLKKEKLDDLECTHVTIVPKKEMHFWIDADKTCKRYQWKQTFQGKVSELTWNYKLVASPTITEETFAFKPPADAKNIRDR